ncbi:ABC transporter permease [Mesobacillus subterraneus]|uniref:ABC transporter permease n=1 Tax=Mesobacillus subterraneus TaxID=285983 RepID=A0A427TPC0_9BACI|nr:ABC transporter permease [Mesobacillus subterraneus]RSD26225.1 ABC transporter permease [Mesobacillus subterraneus]
MNQWFILLKKEFLEMSRNYKWVWVPITFILLGILDPLTSYYLPQIIDSVGDLPEGTVIQIPEPSAAEVFIMSLSEYQLIGILIIVLSTMAIVSGERKSGVVQLILVKPVSYFSYITSKWAGALILISSSLFLGMLASWYYTGVLYEFLPFSDFLAAYWAYALWLILVLTLVVLCSAALKHPGATAMVTLITVFVLNLVGGSLTHALEWSPTQLPLYVSERLTTNQWPEHIWPAAGLAALFTFAFLVMAILLFKRKELAD